MRAFYLAYPDIFQTLSGESYPVPAREKFRTPSGKSRTLSLEMSFERLTTAFPLSWSAYVRLRSVKNRDAHRFYETEALRGGWSVRQLDRQINSQFYERTALSKDKAVMLRFWPGVAGLRRIDIKATGWYPSSLKPCLYR